MAIIDIKGISAENGEKRLGLLEVGTTSTSTHKIPIAIINGEEPGKTISIIGGNHGTEFAGIEAIIRIIKDLDPKKMRGAVLAVPVVNIPQFEFKTARINPVDGLNQNRVYPGNSQGTLSRRTAHIVFSEIASKSDALVDLHGGDIGNELESMAFAEQGEDEELNRISMEMATCFSTKYIAFPPSDEIGRLTRQAYDKLGIPCITTEAGCPSQVLERHIQFHYDGIINTLKYFRILEGKPEMSKPIVDPKEFSFRAKQGGIWHPKVNPGQNVSAGEELGELTDLFGNVIEVYKAPEDAMVSSQHIYYSVSCGENLVSLVFLK